MNKKGFTLGLPWYVEIGIILVGIIAIILTIGNDNQQPPLGFQEIVGKDCPDSWKSRCCNVYNKNTCCPCDENERCDIECALHGQKSEGVNWSKGCMCDCETIQVSFCSGYWSEKV